MDGLEFMKDVGVDWEKCMYVEGEGMEYMRGGGKGKGCDKWFVGGVRGMKGDECRVKVDLVEKGKKYVGRMYEDGKNGK